MTAPPVPRQSTAFVDQVLRPFQQFASTESSGGVVLLVCAIVALVWANVPGGEAYFALWARTFTIGGEHIGLTMSLHHWINDGLMVLFFLLVGLEIKREMLAGELSSFAQASLPVAAAAGGMIVPAAIYALFNWNGPGASGWGIPMATDIAFALGVLALLGSRVPAGLKVFLAALAIADDIGAVLVIAIFYTAKLSIAGLGAAALVVMALLICNRGGIRHPAIYGLLGVLLWFAVVSSGIHATIAGVLLAMTIPARTAIDEDEFLRRADQALNEFRSACDPQAATVLSNRRQMEALHHLERSVEEVQAPLLKMEHALNRVVAFGIMPLFALANAGVRLRGDILATISWSVAGGILFGLVIGKVIGITLASRIAVSARVAELPTDVDWRSVFGVSWLGGIGFTMSLFVADLAFGPGALLDSAKVGILGASILAGSIGAVILLARTRSRKA